MDLAKFLDGLKAKAAAAAPGPWTHMTAESVGGNQLAANKGPVIASFPFEHELEGLGYTDDYVLKYVLHNGQFIAAADPQVVAALVDVAKAAKREHEAFSYVVSRLPEAHAIMESARKANREKFLRESALQPKTRVSDYLAESDAQGEHAGKAHDEIQEAAREQAMALDHLAKVAGVPR